VSQDKVSPELSEYLRKLGKKGGKARMKTMTPEQRTEIAKKAAAKSAEVRTKKAGEKAARGAKPARKRKPTSNTG
jgi:hypothetical protein